MGSIGNLITAFGAVSYVNEGFVANRWFLIADQRSGHCYKQLRLGRRL